MQFTRKAAHGEHEKEHGEEDVDEHQARGEEARRSEAGEARGEEGLTAEARQAGRRSGSSAALELANSIAARHGVAAADLLGRSMRVRTIAARFELYAALRALGWSHARVGRFVGGRAHTASVEALAPAERRAARKLARAA